MKPLLAIVILTCACRSLAASAPEPQSEDGRLAAYFKEHLDDEMKHRPLDATRLGDHRYDNLLDDVSADARAAGVQRVRQTLKELPKRIAYARLTRPGQIDFEIWKQSMERDLWLAENTHPFEEDPRVYNDYITESVYLLLTQSTLPMADNVSPCRSTDGILAAHRGGCPSQLAQAAARHVGNGNQAKSGGHQLL